MSGSGPVGGILLNLGSTISLGNSIETLGVDSSAFWTSGGNYDWEIRDAAPGAAGTGLDLIDVTDSLSLTALTVVSEFNMNLWSLQSVGRDQNGDAINSDPSQGYTWKILTASGGITGFAANAFNITTAAANGDRDLNLIFTTANPGPEAVPEPGTWAPRCSPAARHSCAGVSGAKQRKTPGFQLR